MSWPFVSRATHDQVVDLLREQLTAARAENAELKEDRKLMIDILGVRALGLSLYGKIQMPKEEEEREPMPEPEDDPNIRIPSRLERAAEQTGGKARGIQRKIEAENLGHAAEAQRAYDLARRIGQEEAEAAHANGNGSH